ncbi:MAG TPA: hypothetical protein ENI86_08310 [Acidimicrobiales bacterium]|nr:hypothetical protein [Acidimicrobiales bacterium]
MTSIRYNSDRGTEVGLRLYCLMRSLAVSTGQRLRDESGEGVISAAIAVLIVAGLGALMWVGFRSIWQDAESTTRSKISEIGN